MEIQFKFKFHFHATLRKSTVTILPAGNKQIQPIFRIDLSMEGRKKPLNISRFPPSSFSTKCVFEKTSFLVLYLKQYCGINSVGKSPTKTRASDF